jgi:hypothetical protein
MQCRRHLKFVKSPEPTSHTINFHLMLPQMLTSATDFYKPFSSNVFYQHRLGSSIADRCRWGLGCDGSFLMWLITHTSFLRSPLHTCEMGRSGLACQVDNCIYTTEIQFSSRMHVNPVFENTFQNGKISGFFLHVHRTFYACTIFWEREYFFGLHVKMTNFDALTWLFTRLILSFCHINFFPRNLFANIVSRCTCDFFWNFSTF